jgi:hypothetical protein
MSRARSVPLPPADGSCRYCGGPAYGTDDYGPVHLCCRAWRHVMSFGFSCPSCQVARIVASTGRLPKFLPPLPMTLPDGSPYVPEVGSYVPEASLESTGVRSDAA